MHAEQGFYKLKQVLPECDDIFSSRRWWYRLEIVFESAHISELKNDVIPVSLSEASIEAYQILSSLSKSFKCVDFAVVVFFSAFAEVGFENIGIGDSLIRRLLQIGLEQQLTTLCKRGNDLLVGQHSKSQVDCKLGKSQFRRDLHLCLRQVFS